MRFIFGLQVFVVVAGVVQITGCGDASGPKSGPPAKVVILGGDAQPSPEVGTRLPLPLAIRVTDAQGQNVTAATVFWSTSSGSLIAPTTLSNADGVASVEWTLGELAGTQTATATVTGVTPVTFSERAVAGPIAQIVLARDTVRLLGIGDAFRMTARPADRFGNTIPGGSTVESTDTSIVTADNFGNGAILIAHASNATATIRAFSGMFVKTGTVIVLPPPCQGGSSAFDLAVGEVATLSGTAASEFCVKGTPAGAEFTAIPFYSDQIGSLLRLSISTGGTTISASPSYLSAPRFQLLRTVPSPGIEQDDNFETDLRERSRRELTAMIPVARQVRQQSGGGRFSISVQVPQIGDLMQLNTNATSACTNARLRTGRVAAITTRAIVVTDTANPANGFTDADLASFGVTFDTLVYPVDTENFGEPTDIDSNQRIILFFTRAVNELTPPLLNSYVGGYFFSRDLFPKTATGSVDACPASNVAEMFYLLVPDPDGVVNQNVRTTEFVRTVTAGVLAHEFQHLINASRHLYVNTSSSAFEDGFLDEGLAHVAEELAFYRASGLSPRQNISAITVQSSQKISGAFDGFGAANIRRYREFLINPLTNSPYADNTNLTTRGAIWAFLRYAADRRGGLEVSAWFQLANPPAGSHGILNLTRVFGPELISWVRDWGIANYADDFTPAVGLATTHPSWDFRSTVAFVNQGNFPLATQQMDTVSITSVGIGDGGSAYLRFGVGAGAIGGGRITARGAPVPSGFSLSILRTK
ncbi:MAG: Ig-like domain-containing protein [Gemmatimonadota bacterium]|nr:Ig-like domain-containing protein [Gemmatimonadota bacterium]